jgi:hypothetical protein
VEQEIHPQQTQLKEQLVAILLVLPQILVVEVAVQQQLVETELRVLLQQVVLEELVQQVQLMQPQQQELVVAVEVVLIL